MRAMQPTRTGRIERSGARIGYEVFGEGETTLLLMPTWCVVHSRIWKMQVPYLARHYRVVTFDGVGNGLSDRPAESSRYTAEAHVADALAVLDATETDRVIAFAASGGTHRTLRLTAEHPDRVDGAIFIGPNTYLVAGTNEEVMTAFMSGDRDVFLEKFMTAAFSEPYSSKAIEDGIEWGSETSLEVMATAYLADVPTDLDAYRRSCASIECPVLVVQGSEDQLTPEEQGRALVEAIGPNASLVLVDGGGHRTDVRDPVWFSLLVRDFVDELDRHDLPREHRWPRATSRPRRALFLSSPIGLGHARRDVAIAKELRDLRPDVEIDWLAQDPVTHALKVAGERIHPASVYLAGESAHFETETAGHDLHCFQAWRRLDEILLSNFMVLHDVLAADAYDLVIGDEAWEADHFFHENPELKRTAFAWMTDFVGWLPVPEGGEAEIALTAAYNAEMVEHIARYPYIRDRSLFVGDPEDVVPDLLGPDLPPIRDWTEAHFDFTGYITGIAPTVPAQRDELRDTLGYRSDEIVCVVTAGGSGVGATLLHQVLEAFPYAARLEPALRMVVVAGPRIDPATFPKLAGNVEIRGYLPNLDRHLAACDVAVIQGGLTTAMELTANGRPFLYFPLARHFEQQRHVPFRLDRYRAGRRMELSAVGPEEIAEALVAEAHRDVDYAPVESDGARRAAAMLAELI